MESMLKPMLPYILQEALGVYGKRQGTSGRTPMDFSPLQAMLGQYLGQYTGKYGSGFTGTMGDVVGGGGGGSIRNAAMPSGITPGGSRSMDGMGRFQRSYDAY